EKTEKGFSFPFIRFTNWKQVAKRLKSLSDYNYNAETVGNALKEYCEVSIHTLHELEARLALQN
ncbi:MAG: hypothetical protein ACKO90_07430, partial [Microcystis panniformis]